MFAIRKKLASTSATALKKNFGVKTAVSFDIPREQGRGDLSTSIALQLSKQLGKPPRDIAASLVKELESIKGVTSVEVVGPGYVNIHLETKTLVSSLSEALEASEPVSPKAKTKPVIIEYSQPNIAKPLGIHHILSTVIGQTLSNLYRHTGYPVISWNYIGDWGTQFGKLAVAYGKWGKKKPIEQYNIDELLDLYVKFHEEAESDTTLEDQGREAFRKLEQGDEDLRDFWQKVVKITKNSLLDLYTRLHVAFDTDLGESFYEDKVDDVLTEGKKKKIFTEGEGGALIVQFAEELKMPPYMVQKSDGATLYSTRDLAQMKYRMEEYHPQAILILTDIAQKLHFEQLVQTCALLGWKLPEFENVLFGRMRFADKSMSTRKGNILKLEHVLDEAVSRAGELIEQKGSELEDGEKKDLQEMIGIGAVVYGVLSQNRKMDMVFDWDKFLTFEGNSAPYLQYTHARARSVLRKAGVDKVDSATYTGALTQQERSLIHLLLQFPDVLEAAREELLPHRLCNYLYELSQSYNTFYNAETILKAEPEQRDFRLALTYTTASILKTGAEILTLRVPDRM